MKRIRAFLQYRLSLIAFALISMALMLSVLALAGQDMRVAWYCALIMGFVLLCVLLIDAGRFFRQRRLLEHMQHMRSIAVAMRSLPEPQDELQTEYTRLLSRLNDELAAANRSIVGAHSESVEYYTLWVHQIKTPIAALKLALAQQDGVKPQVVERELFKIEQYADLALRYIKLDDIASDTVIERFEVDAVVREAVKKYALLFVHKHLKVNLDNLCCEVTTDRRWYLFIVEQFISNAVKYTNTGSVSIFMDADELVISDTGIGIRAEDLPRIFEKGYTGYNGRLYERASGIGLYLAKKCAGALDISLRVESVLGEGTRAFIKVCAHYDVIS